MPFSRNRAGTGGGPSRASGGAGATVGFGAVAAAAAFAVAVHRAARSRTPVGPSDLKSAIAEDGTVPDLEALLQQIADKGLEPGARPEVWPLLLGVYGADETYEHRAASYKRLREGFESLLRRCQELEAACLEATSSSRRSARASSSCGAPQQSTNSTATSATASPLYSNSPANATCRPAGLSAAAAGAGAATVPSSGGDLPSVLTPVRRPSCEDGTWGKAEAADAEAMAAATTVDWEEEGSSLGHADAFSAFSEVSFLGHVSRADVPPALRPYWEAQQSIALDAVRVDFKKSMLPGATPLAAAVSGSSAAAVSGLTLSLRGLGFTGLGGSGGGGAAAAAAAPPSVSALSPAASAPVSAGPGNDGGGAAAAAGAPAAASSGRLTSWFREKFEEYRASRQQQAPDREQQQHQQQGQEQKDTKELQDLQEGSFGLVPRSPNLKEEQAEAAEPTAVAAAAGLGAHPQEQREQQREQGEMTEEGLKGGVMSSPEQRSGGALSAAADGDAAGVAHPTTQPEAAAAAGGEGGGCAAATSRFWRSAGGALSCEASNAAAPIHARPGHASLSGLPPPSLGSGGGGGEAAPPATRSKPLSSVFAAFASTRGSSADEPLEAVGGTESGVPPAPSPAGSPASAACSDPRVGGGVGGGDDSGPASAAVRASSSFFSFTARMRQLASAPTLTPAGPAASCPSSPLLQADASALAGSNGPNGHQTGQDRSASVSSLPSFTTSSRHTSEAGGAASCSFAQLPGREAADAAGGGSDGGAAAATAGGGSGCGSGCPPPSSPSFPPCLSALARAQMEHARLYFSPGQMRLVERLVSLLSAYAAHDPDLGYCQGMSDLALPFVLLLEDDVIAFWCFVRFMGKVRANFVPGPDGAFERLASLGSLVARLDEQVGAHLSAIHAGHCHFAHRMVAAQMRRELVSELAVRVWEQLWADDLLEQMAAAAAGQEAAAAVAMVRFSAEAAVKGQEEAAARRGVETEEGCAVELQEFGASGGWRAGNGGNGEVGGGGVVERVDAEAAQGDAEGAFGNGGVAAASAALTAAGGGQPESEAATSGGPDAGVSLPPCAPTEPSSPNGAGAETTAAVRGSASRAKVTHGSCRLLAATEAATHGTLQGRPAAISYSEGVTSRVPPAAVEVSCLGLASALSCEDAAAPTASNAPWGPAAVSGGETLLPYADDATPKASSDAAASAASAHACAASAPVFDRELFLYLVAAVVLSQRRRLLECRELDDVLRLFQSLPPMSRSEVNDALRKAREYRDVVVPRQRPPPAAPPPPLPPPPPPPDGGRSGATSPPERIWGLLSLRSDPPAAKL
ncbi:hypothetical protein PLESTB_000992800 [Pleodorina starrii]|uniref:Rab-GAP TBC domain-containing protein n=1 Tax=Pleodorina starrii TaxID=330485 RepID=A0A9W6BNR3_9CHLO|nr:hypothetical protein PLESTM_000555800 [Pleodorina starrii]GLC55489.1 hypothetical protein PLESTB_000992800 [Pleodorina starrii]GLC73884.1 hypothetical protein PLESTF_001431500 [Pleodorina starrii]